MDDRRIVVVKVGGSLFDWPGMPDRLSAFLRASSTDRHVLIAGGGGFADVVRGLDRIHGLGEVRSHGLALRAMELASHALATLVPGLIVVESVSGCDAAWSAGMVPILAPIEILDRMEQAGPSPLPRSWEVTSDSIAARLASTIGARELVLLKSVAPAPGSIVSGRRPSAWSTPGSRSRPEQSRGSASSTCGRRQRPGSRCREHEAIDRPTERSDATRIDLRQSIPPETGGASDADEIGNDRPEAADRRLIEPAGQGHEPTGGAQRREPIGVDRRGLRISPFLPGIQEQGRRSRDRSRPHRGSRHKRARQRLRRRGTPPRPISRLPPNGIAVAAKPAASRDQLHRRTRACGRRSLQRPKAAVLGDRSNREDRRGRR